MREHDLSLEAVTREASEGRRDVAHRRLQEEQCPTGAKMARGLVADAVDEHAAVNAALPRAGRPAPRQTLRRARKIRRIGGDQVEALSRHRCEQIPSERSHADSVGQRVEAGRPHRSPRHIGRHRLSPVRHGG